MIVYHGTPLGGDRAGVARFLNGRHALVPFLRQEDCAVALACCQSVVFDNSAFTAWKQGEPITDWEPYYEWCREYARHPAFAWAIIPDVVDGTEKQNDALIHEWQTQCWDFHNRGVPVWHLHEGIGRLKNLARRYDRVCLGSSGEFPTPGAPNWWRRMREAMDAICDKHGRPECRLHGLRMAAPEITSRFPFASVDSTNVAQNASLLPRFGMYSPPQRWQRAEILARRMEHFEAAERFNRQHFEPGHGEQNMLFSAAEHKDVTG
jgi:hypothetical protein